MLAVAVTADRAGSTNRLCLPCGLTVWFCRVVAVADRAAMTAAVQKAPGESVEWVNMCFRKIWRVYQRGLERWITDLLQPVFDGLISVRAQVLTLRVRVPLVLRLVACGQISRWLAACCEFVAVCD
jgi:hypothetical protein